MTDGIIQQVFSICWAHKSCKECDYAINEVMPRLIEEIREKLIVSINTNGSINDFNRNTRKAVLHQLMGDGQK